MALTINTNTTSQFAQQTLSANQKNLAQTLTRLSSGLRVNSASDDPAGLAIAEQMKSTINGLIAGSRNGNDGISLVQTAQSTMQQVLNTMQRMKTLATQAASGTNGSQDLENLDTEYQKLLGEIERVTQITTFNGINLLDGSTTSINIQIGANNTSNDQITITLTQTSTGSAGLNIAGTDITDTTNASSAIGSLQTAIQSLTTALADIGANEANLESAINSNQAFATSLESAKSRIVDADFAEESSNLAKYNILSQSNVAMLAQANAAPQLVLSLLRQ